MFKILFYREYDNWTYGSEHIGKAFIKSLKRVEPIIEPIITVIKNAVGVIIEIAYEFVENGLGH